MWGYLWEALNNGMPVLVSLHQSGFYQLFSSTAVLPYQEAWLETKLPEDK